MKRAFVLLMIALAFMAPAAHAVMGTYADCQDQATPFGPKSQAYQCCVERHFEAVMACRAQNECKDRPLESCPACKDPVFEIENCPERA